MTGAEVTLAEARVAEARQRLDGTVGRLQTELEPRRLARVALAEVTEGGERAVRAGTEVARRNPGVLAGGATLLFALVTGRQVARLFGKKKRQKRLPSPEDTATPAERIGS
ncbi:phosphatase [uncultured Sphingomonas sp.]|uniref:phosphatase n=1 Tax=uncultured Sphingomonas sp. TaxID=158754 RepID=UPI0030FA18DD